MLVCRDKDVRLCLHLSIVFHLRAWCDGSWILSVTLKGRPLSSWFDDSFHRYSLAFRSFDAVP